jgi:pimeloyl-ACP methyl ester carboxylesterase
VALIVRVLRDGLGLSVVEGRVGFSVPVAGGALGGWVIGVGPPVLLLHGGPGLSYEYLDGLAAELGPDHRVAAYQQRGLEPSTLEGPFTVAQAIADVLAVLDGLEWPRALIVGHSWGGHLALRFAAAHPERLLGALAVDPLGIVGDGGMAAFEAEMLARTPKEGRERAHELDERAMAGEGTAEDGLESLRIVWPAYFADPGHAPEMPPIRMSVEAYSGIIGEVAAGADEVATKLATSGVPYGVIAGAGSPMPWGQAARASVDVAPQAFLTVVPAAGHFPWLEAPGSVRDALKRLSDE